MLDDGLLRPRVPAVDTLAPRSTQRRLNQQLEISAPDFCIAVLRLAALQQCDTFL
jgi:hypothetical protein